MTPGFRRHASSTDSAPWLLVSGRTFLAVVTSGTAPTVVEALWDLAGQESVAIEAIVGAMPLAGADAVGDFAVVSLHPGVETAEILITAVVRGSASVDVISVGGARRFTAGGVQPWLLADFRSVTSLVLGGDSAPTAARAEVPAGSLPIGIGVVEGTRLWWSLLPLPLAAEAVAPLEEARPEESTPPAESARVAPAPGEAALPVEPAAPAAAVPAMPPLPEPPVAAETAVDLEETIIRGRRVPLPEIDDDTIIVTRGSRHSPSSVPDAAIAPAESFAYRIGGGEAVVLDVPVFIGRRPSAPRIVSGVAPRLVTVESSDQQVSATHLQLQQVGSSVVLTDLRSTNGTIVSAPNAPAERLRPGESRVVLVGTMVDIGDGNIIEIVPNQH